MFEWIFQADRYVREYERLERKLKPAHTRGASSCVRCGLCCWKRPPVLTRADLERLAAREGLTPAVFFARFCVVDDPGDILGPVLRREHQAAGEYLSQRETYSIETPCVYHDAAVGCRVHDIKPEQCQRCECWKPDDDSVPDVAAWKEEDLRALGWNGERE